MPSSGIVVGGSQDQHSIVFLDFSIFYSVESSNGIVAQHQVESGSRPDDALVIPPLLDLAFHHILQASSLLAPEKA